MFSLARAVLAAPREPRLRGSSPCDNLILTAMRLASVYIHCAVMSAKYSRWLVRVLVYQCTYKEGHYTTEVWLSQVFVVLVILRPLSEEK